MGIHAKLLKVMSELGWVEKRGNNSAQNYKYVMADDVAAAVREKLAEHGVCVSASVLSNSERVVETGTGKKIRVTSVNVRWTFTDIEPSGGSLAVDVPGEAMDAGDKAVYKAMTGSLKYAMKLNFLLPTGEDPEEDSALDKEVYTPAKQAPAPARAPAARPAPSAPQPKPAPAPAGSVKVPYGRNKGKDFSDPAVTDDDLSWLISKFEESVAKNDPKWHEKNIQVLAAAQAEQAKRILGAEEMPSPDSGSDIPF